MTSDERARMASRRCWFGWGPGLVLGAFVATLPRSAASQAAAASSTGGPVAVSADAAASGPERAAPSAPDEFLVWHAPAGCSTAAAVRERVGELLGEPELDLKRVRRVEGRVSETRAGWALHLTLIDAFGKRERELAAPHCADLAEAAAVAISLAFEAARGRERAEPPASSEPEAAVAPTPEPRSAVSPAPDVPAASAPAPDAAGSFEPWLGAELWLDAQALPSAAAGGSAAGVLRARGLRIGAFVGWLPGADRSVGPGQSVQFSLLLGGVRACYTLGHGILDTALCAGLEAGRLSARSSGLVAARSASDLWLAPQLGLELARPLSSRLAVYLRGDALTPLLRQGYAVNETDDVHHVAGIGVRAALGVLVGL